MTPAYLIVALVPLAAMLVILYFIHRAERGYKGRPKGLVRLALGLFALSLFLLHLGGGFVGWPF